MALYVLIAEGYTDCALLEAILEKCMSFKKYDNINEMPELFRKLVGSYPNESGEMIRQDMPHFYHYENKSVVVKVAGGATKIASKVEEVLQALALCEEEEHFAGFLTFTDADNHSQEKIIKTLQENYALSEMQLCPEIDKVIFEQMEYNHSLYIYPSDGYGAVEKILLNMATEIYPELSVETLLLRPRLMGDSFIELRQTNWAKQEEQQEFYADKVQFGTIASALKPDRPVGFAIKDELVKQNILMQLEKVEEFAKLHKYLEQKIMQR